MNIGIPVIGTLNQLFITGSYTKIKFSKKVVNSKTSFFAVGLFFVFALALAFTG